jgi:hypothetical protein
MLLSLACLMAGLPVAFGKLVLCDLLPHDVWWLVPVVAGGLLWSASAGWRAYRVQRWGGVLASIIVCWLLLKVAFAYIYVPERNDSRHPRAKAEALAHLIPDGETLHLIQLKDEGIMFYYRRPVLRLKKWDDLPLANEPVYCIMTPFEREQVGRHSEWMIVAEQKLQDAQGMPMFFLAIRRGDPPIRQARSEGMGRKPCLPPACLRE